MPYDFLDIGTVERSTDQQKQMLVGLSRGIDKLAGKRGGREDKPRSAAQQLIAAIATQVRQRQHEAWANGTGGGDRWRSIAVRAVTNPSMTTVAGNAAELAHPANAGVFDLLTPDSAYSQLSRARYEGFFGRLCVGQIADALGRQ